MAPKPRGKRKSDWQKNFLKLKRWLTAHNDEYPCRTAETAQAKRLARWVNNIRVQYRNGKLLQAHIEKLEGLPAWTWVARLKPWDDMHAELVKWLDAGEDPERAGAGRQCAFPPCNTSLGQWIRRQRCAYRQGKLSAARVSALDALPAWTWEPGAPHLRAPQPLAQHYLARPWPPGALAAASSSAVPMELV